LADIKIEIAKNAGGAPLTVTTGTTAVAWTATQPSNYVYFDKTVTGALSLPVEIYTNDSSALIKIEVRRTGNVIVYTLRGGGGTTSSSNTSTTILAAGTLPVWARPDSRIVCDIRTNGYTTNAFCNINPDGSIVLAAGTSTVIDNGNPMTATHIVNNVAATHLVNDPPVDFLSQITGGSWLDTASSSAMFNRSTGLVVINAALTMVATSNGLRFTIPDKYKPAIDQWVVAAYPDHDGDVGLTWRLKLGTDGKAISYKDGAVDSTAPGAVRHFSFVYYVEPEAGGYIIKRPVENELFISSPDTTRYYRRVGTFKNIGMANFNDGYFAANVRSFRATSTSSDDTQWTGIAYIKTHGSGSVVSASGYLGVRINGNDLELWWKDNPSAWQIYVKVDGIVLVTGTKNYTPELDKYWQPNTDATWNAVTSRPSGGTWFNMN
jgi:hypothetical protein